MATRIWAITRCADDNGINLLDFGAIRVFPPHFLRGVIDLFEATRDGDEDKAIHAYEGWGFVGISREKAEVLNQWGAFPVRTADTGQGSQHPGKQ